MKLNSINIIKFIQNNYLFLFIFFIFLYINLLTPPVGDDWEVGTWFSVGAGGNIITALHGIYYNWLHFNGRGLLNFLMSYFCYFSFFWKFFSASMICFIVYAFSKIFKYKYKYLSIALSILFVLSVSNNIRMEVYSIICANIAYLVPISSILLFLLFINNHLNKNYINEKTILKPNYIFFISIFCLFISTLIENISIGFTGTLALLNIYIFIKNKKFNKLFLFSLISSVVGTIFMLSSPGIRVSRELYNPILGIIGTLRQSLHNNINLIIFDNKFIFLCITLITFFGVISGDLKISNKYLKYLYLFFLSIISGIFIFPMLYSYLPIPHFLQQTYFLALRFSNYFQVNRLLISFFWLFYLISFILPITSFKQHRTQLLFIFFVGIFSLIPASLVTTVGARIITITVFMFIGIGSTFLSKINFSKSQYKSIIFWIILFLIYIKTNILFVTYNNITQTQKIRQMLINDTLLLQHQRKWNFSQTLILPAFKENTLYPTSNPPPLRTNGHYLFFKIYNQLDPKTKVIFDDGFGYSELNFNLLSQNISKMEIKPLDNQYTYSFILLKDGFTFYTSSPSAYLSHEFKLYDPGKYTLRCNMINSKGEVKTAYSADEIIIKNNE
jgi:hypothetical protein